MKTFINTSFICLLLAYGVQGQGGLMGLLGNLFSKPSSGLSGGEPAVGTNKATTSIGQANVPFGGTPSNGGVAPGTYAWGFWGRYSTCSVSCGSGVAMRQRVCYYYGRRPPTRPSSPSSNSFGGGLDSNSIMPFLFLGDGTSSSSGLSSMLTLSLLSGGGGMFGNSRGAISKGRSPNTNSYYKGPYGCPGNNLNSKKCNLRQCAKSCLTQWGAFGQCSASCGTSAVRTRARLCTCASCQEPLLETLPCLNLPACVHFTKHTMPDITTTTVAPISTALPAEWSAWSRWSVCSVTCGGGSRARSRYCLGKNQFACGLRFTDNQECQTQPCVPETPVPSVWGEWGEYSLCSATCGEATKSRMRDCSTPNGCSGSDVETIDCDFIPCPTPSPLPPVWGEWGAYSLCSSTCGKATKLRMRVCPIPDACPGPDAETADCDFISCPTPEPIISKYSNWSPWEACRPLIGANACIQERIRQCLGPLGTCVGLATETRRCNTGICAPTTLAPTTTTTRAWNQDRCDARKPESRVDCGYKGISRNECLSRGCCYNDRVYNFVWCFYDNVFDDDEDVPTIDAQVVDERPTKITLP